MNHKTHTRRWTRARAVMALGMALGLGVAVTLAVFTDEAKFTSSFNTGKIDIQVDDKDPAVYTFSDWMLDNAKAGKASRATLTVKNAGSLPFNYTMAAPTIEPSSALSDNITVSIAQVADEAACEAETFGTPVATGKLASIAIAEARSLAVGASESLCFEAKIDDNAPNTVMGETVTPVFTLTATQT